MTVQFAIDGQEIGPQSPPYIIAEMSANHNGSIENALKILRMAKVNGAHAVKIQTFTADTITLDCGNPEFIVRGGLWDGRKLYDLYQEAHMPWDWLPQLFSAARDIGITLFSSVFDETSIAFLEKLNCPAYKIASLELSDHPLIEAAAKTGKPLIMSTGTSSLGEIANAVGAARRVGCDKLILLYCTSGYPTPITDSNLKSIPALSQALNILVGLSDHTLGIAASVAAVAMGAVVIEKHVTMDRAEGGLDAEFSLNPHELADLTTSTFMAHQALGRVSFGEAASEAVAKTYRRSLYVVQDIRAGEPFTRLNTRSIRPGNGLAPIFLPEILGRHAAKDLSLGTPLSWRLIRD